MTSVSSHYIATIEHCPKCNQKGVLKRRTQSNGLEYLQVDHYRRLKGMVKYDRCCYLLLLIPGSKTV